VRFDGDVDEALDAERHGAASTASLYTDPVVATR
jgi:hypothetical protein